MSYGLPTGAGDKVHGRFAANVNGNVNSIASINYASQTQGDSDLWRNYDDHYSGACAHIRIYDNGGALQREVTVGKLLNQAEIVDWLNTNAAGLHADITLFSVIESDKSCGLQVANVHAWNTTFQRLRGGRRTKDRVRIADATGPWGSANLQGFLTDLWSEAWAGAGLNYPFPTWGATSERLFWLATDYRSWYDYQGLRTEIEYGGGQRQVLDATGAIVAGASPTYAHSTLDPAFGTVNVSGTAWTVRTRADALKEVPARTLNGGSTVMGVPVIGEDGGRALYVKPLGVDGISLPVISDTRVGGKMYEALAGPRNDGKLRVRRIENRGGAFMHGGPYTAADFFPVTADDNGTAAYGGNEYGGADVGFHIRDTLPGGTGNVSETYPGRLVWRRGRRIPDHWVLTTDGNQ